MKLFFVICIFLLGILNSSPTKAAPSIETYVKQAGEGASIVPAGQLKLNGNRALCGRRPTALNPHFDDYGGAYITADPGYIILNPKKMEGLSTTIKFYIYSHECGHQMRGESEEVADCFAIQRGVRYGWLNASGMDEICKFMWDHKESYAHDPGPIRCRKMRACFAAEKAKRKK